MDDPFKLIIDVMRKEGSIYNPPSVMLGKVINPAPDLLISVNGLQLDKDDLKAAEYLTGSLKNGDEVVILPAADKKVFLIICKVVSL